MQIRHNRFQVSEIYDTYGVCTKEGTKRTLLSEYNRLHEVIEVQKKSYWLYIVYQVPKKKTKQKIENNEEISVRNLKKVIWMNQNKKMYLLVCTSVWFSDKMFKLCV